MASNILSRLLPSPSDDSPYHDDHLSATSSERHRDIDEENLGEHFQEQDLDHLLAEAAGSQFGEGTSVAGDQPGRTKSPESRRTMPKSKWAPSGRGSTDDDDDVPESLLLEDHQDRPTRSDDTQNHSTARHLGLPPPVPGPATDRTHAQWEATRAQQRLHDERRTTNSRQPQVPRSAREHTLKLNYTRKEKAMWVWTNVQDLDSFLYEMYSYYVERGVYSILLGRILSLLQIAFIIGFGTFLTFCIDYSLISQKTYLRDMLYDKCYKERVHGLWSFTLVVIFTWWLYTLVEYAMDVPRLWKLHDIYHYLLDIPDADIQTVSWQLIVSRLMSLRDANIQTAQNITPANRKFLRNQSKAKMDAHDIANRLMRKENYLIALFNKDILDLSVPIPFLGQRHIMSKTTEWHVALAILDFVFDQRGQVKQLVLTDKNRAHLIAALKRRFILTGLISIICAPFAATYYVVWIFFRYFTEFQKDPSQLGARSFTRLAEWKFREFNELPHLFETRRNMALIYSERYLQQFPKHKTEIFASFLLMISSAILAVLGLAALFDSQSFLGVQITDGRTSLFYIGVFTAIWAAARGAGPQEEPTMDPELAMSYVIECTRFCPASWKDRLHSDEVRQEFVRLYQLRLGLLLEELISIIVTPFILIYKLPACSERVVDFFREFTIHVDGLGNVCSFAVFDFKRGVENVARHRRDREDPGLRDDYFSTKDGKLMASVAGFQDAYITNATSTRRFNRKGGPFPFVPPPHFDLYNENPRHSTIQTPQMRGAQHTPRVQAQYGRNTPMHSILLDPHHQPSPAQRPQHRPCDQRRPFVNVDESPETHAHMTTSRIIEEDSKLGDSWTKTVDQDESSDEAEDDTSRGVLGLLYQFQKKQAQGAGATGAMV